MDEQNKNSVEQTEVPNKSQETVEAPKEVETKSFTEDQVEAIVQRRLERERSKISKQLDGIDIKEAKQLLEEKKQKEQELALQRGEFEKVMKETVSKKDQEISKLVSELQKIRIDEQLVNTASNLKAINPNEVKALLRNSVKLNDSGNVEVVSENGTPRYTDKGEPMTVNNLVQEYLNNNPHHLSATPSGTGSGSGIGGETPKPLSVKDLDMNNPNDREVYKKIRKERQQGGMKANLVIG
jgi:hypothetical protein